MLIQGWWWTRGGRGKGKPGRGWGWGGHLTPESGKPPDQEGETQTRGDTRHSGQMQQGRLDCIQGTVISARRNSTGVWELAGGDTAKRILWCWWFHCGCVKYTLRYSGVKKHEVSNLFSKNSSGKIGSPYFSICLKLFQNKRSNVSNLKLPEVTDKVMMTVSF